MEEYGAFGNGEFSEIVKSIVDELHQRINGVGSEQIPDIIGGGTGLSEVNCYPGYPSNKCCQTAFFVSLNSKTIARGGGHLHFRKILERLIDHMIIKCGGITKNVVIITDSWDARIASNEQKYIDKIKSQANVELYFFTVSPVFSITQIPF